jgi:hypothetical protein
MRRVAVLTIVLGLWLGAATRAAAADYYVDRDAATNNPPCQMVDPCKDVSVALGLADANDATADTVHVGYSTGSYSAITIPNTPVVLVGNEFNLVGPPAAASLIDGGAGSAGVTLSSGSLPRTIRGFTIRGVSASSNSLEGAGGSVGDNVTIEDNRFDDGSASLSDNIFLFGSPLIRDNVVVDNDSGAPVTSGIRVDGAGSVQITGNFVAGDERPISVIGNPTSTATVDHNTLVVLSDTLGQTGGIYMQNTTGDVSRNLITPSAANTDPATSGIYAAGVSTGGTLRLTRNRTLGFAGAGNHGVDLVGQDPVTMSDDLIAGNWRGVEAFTNVPTVSLTNETIWGSTDSELSLLNTTAATIGSSIIGDKGVVSGGTATCTSSFSRGPLAVGVCGPYATNATPAFVDSSHPDPSTNDYHLTPANPSLIDMGNPAAPAPGELDLDGGPRALDAIADGSCAPRRDIGAYEVVANNSDCNPPPPTTTTPSSAPAPPASVLPVKKCKKKGKKSATTAKKKGCRKKRK